MAEVLTRYWVLFSDQLVEKIPELLLPPTLRFTENRRDSGIPHTVWVEAEDTDPAAAEFAGKDVELALSGTTEDDVIEVQRRLQGQPW